MSNKKAFTLIELLVVISIISLLSSIVFSSLSNAREKARMAAGMEFEANILHGIGDQLIGEWKFNEGSGTAIDTSSFGQNGVVHGSTWNGSSGYDNKGSYYFNGSSYIDLWLKKITPTNNVTFTAWVKGSGSPSGGGIIFFRGPAPLNHTGIKIYGNQVRAHWAGLGMWATQTGLNIPSDKWTFVAMSVTPKKIILYAGDKSYTYLPTTYGVSSFPVVDLNLARLGIGVDIDMWTFWNGNIDNVRIYTAPINS